MRLGRRPTRLSLALAASAGAAAVALALGAGCGPSFQAIYEGDVRFEHCYALDENSSVALRQKSDCWTDWLQHYTYGQTRDRVVYATARARAMSQLGQAPTDEAMMSAAPGEVPQSGITAPAPTSAFAPPPKTLDLDSGVEGGAWGRSPAPAASWMSNLPPPPTPAGGGGAAGGSAGGSGAGGGSASGFGASNLRPPGADCTESCVRDWDRCRATCTPLGGAGGDVDAGTKPGCTNRCDRVYKGCLRGCAAK